MVKAPPAPPVKLNRTVEGKLLFPSSDAYNKTVETILSQRGGDPKILQELLNSAEIVIDEKAVPFEAPKPADNNAPQAPVGGYGAAPAQPAEPAPDSKPKNLFEKMKETAKKENLDIVYDSEEKVINGVINKEKRIKHLNSEVERLSKTAAEVETNKRRIKELEDELAKVKSAPAATPSAPAAKPNVGESKQVEIQKLRSEMDAIADPYSETYIFKRKQLDAAMVYEMDRLQKIATVAPDMSPVMKQIEALQAGMSEIRGSVDATTRKQQIELKRRSDELDISELQKLHKEEFATGKSVYDIDEDYRKFGTDLYRTMFGEDPSTIKQMQDMVEKYYSQDESLLQKAKTVGLEPPPDLPQYMKICELLSLRDSLKTNPEFANITLEQAWQIQMVREGKVAEAMNAQRQIGAEALRNGQTQRDTNFAKQLETAGGRPSEEVGDGMTNEQAMKIVESIKPLEAQKDPKKNELLRSAYRRLGIVTQ